MTEGENRTTGVARTEEPTVGSSGTTRGEESAGLTTRAADPWSNRIGVLLLGVIALFSIFALLIVSTRTEAPGTQTQRPVLEREGAEAAQPVAEELATEEPAAQVANNAATNAGTLGLLGQITAALAAVAAGAVGGLAGMLVGARSSR
jgi:hypothetical protein